MPSIEIKKDLYDDIIEFCKFNGVEDVNAFISESLRMGFDMKKYGDSFAMFFGKTEQDIVHIKPQETNALVEEQKVEEPVMEEKILVEEPKKRGRKKKAETKIEEPTIQPEESIEKEPVYVIKQETKEEEKPKQKIPVKLKRPDDNYGVYDEF